MKIHFLCLMLPLGLCHCGKEEAPPVGVLKTTTHEFTLHAGSEGTLYSVRDGSGREIVRMVSAGELAAKFPELNEDLKNLYGGSRILESPFRSEYPPLGRFDETFRETRKVESEVSDLSNLPEMPDLRTPRK